MADLISEYGAYAFNEHDEHGRSITNDLNVYGRSYFTVTAPAVAIDVSGDAYVQLNNSLRNTILNNTARMVNMAQYTFKKSDYGDKIEATLKDEDGAIDLSSYDSVKMYIRDRSGTTQMSDVDCTITNATEGKIEYDWTSGDVIDTPGTYEVEFKIVGSDGELTVPNEEHVIITVEEDIE